MTNTSRRLSVVVASIMIGFLTLVMAPTAASAAPSSSPGSVMPFSAVGCAGDACIFLGNPSSGKVTVTGCAWKTTFTGHLEVTGPNGLVKNSPNQQWKKTSHYCQDGDAHYAVSVAATVGKYCVTAWEGVAPNYTNYGTACDNVE
jgi:hypothetical protein